MRLVLKLVFYMNNMEFKFKITFWENIPERTFIVDETNFYPRYFLGINGLLYENYGTQSKPMWDIVFDSDYKIEIINKK